MRNQYDDLKDKMQICQSDMQSMELRLHALSKDNAALKKQIGVQELYSRRENLIFTGVAESVSENCAEKIHSVLCDKLGIEDAKSRILLSRCHRLGPPGAKNRQRRGSPDGPSHPPVRPRPIIVRFQSHPDRESVWKKRANLKGSGIFMKEDIPETIEEERRSLYPILKRAKDAGHKATVVGNKLVIGGKSYTVSSLNSLPPGLSPRDVLEVQDDNYHFFFGRLSPFSNFHISPFTSNGREYNCVEQYYQEQRARCASDSKAAKEILNTRDPSLQKKIGKSVKIAQEQWLEQKARCVMIEALQAKFDAHPDLAMYLKLTEDKHLVECNKYDSVWGIGLDLNSDVKNKSEEWKGKNWLGECLMEVRKNITV